MSRVPKDMDQLMWLVAEAGDLKAADEFASRYPEHRLELYKRFNMVRQLKESNPASASSTSAQPQWRPPTSQKPSRAPARWSWAMAALALATIGAASYGITKFATANRANDSVNSVQPFSQNDVNGHETRGPLGAPTNTTLPEKTASTNPTTPQPGKFTNPETLQNPVPNPAPPPGMTIKLDDVELTTAIQAIGAQANLQLVLGPGLPNPKISLDYRGVNAVDVIQDLGRRYGFTAFDQGDGSILIIPATDVKATTGTSDPSPLRP